LDHCSNITGSTFKNFPISILKFYIIHCQNFENDYFKDIPKKVRNLKISHCPKFNGAGLQDSIPDNLNTLDLSYTEVRNPILYSLKENHRLTFLHLDHTLITDNLFTFLPSSLVKLSVQNCNITDFGIKDLPQSLMDLSLRDCKRLSGQSLADLSRSLKILDLSCSDTQEFIDVEDLKRLPPLRKLKVIVDGSTLFDINYIENSVIIG